MIYPESLGLVNVKEARLRTLESVWVQGKLRMWGRWSYLGGGSVGNMFNQLLASKKITKTAIQQALADLKKSGLSEQEMRVYLQDLLVSRYKSSLAFCTDDEALLIDGVVGQVLRDYPGLRKVIDERYTGRGKSKRKIAESVHENHPEWCYATCRNRVDQWLGLAEFMLYRPMCDAFEVSHRRFYVSGGLVG